MKVWKMISFTTFTRGLLFGFHVSFLFFFWGVEVLLSNCWSHSFANMFCSSGSSGRTSKIGVLLGTFLDFLPNGNLS